MATIKVKRQGTAQLNFVYAYDPLPEDRLFVVVVGLGGRGRELGTLPICHYDALLALAVQCAAFMDEPIELVPITAKEYIELNRDGLTRHWAKLSDEARAGAIAAWEGRLQ
jgi:hypothetical protein